ncbi:methyltransferase family protein, partial [Aquipuribacter hungaricus]
MTVAVGAWAALVLDVAGLLVVFVVRTWLHRRRTGTSGFNGISGAPGSAQWWGGVLFVVALVLGLLAPVAALTGVVGPVAGGWRGPVAWLGVVVLLVGFAGVLWGQGGMGSSWRIGVRQDERTDLVTGGVFGWVRNPIFTAMLLAQVGLVLLVPSVVSAAALVSLWLAVQLQVRLLEEPYLLRRHGHTYARYAARTGRFVPVVGRLREASPVGPV